MILVYLAFFAVVSWATNLGLGWNFLAQALMSILLGSALIAFGILLSAVTKRARTSIILFLSFLAFFLVTDLAAGVMGLMEFSENTASPLIFARDVLSYIRTATCWFSPFDDLDRGLTAIVFGNWGLFARRTVEALAYTGVLLWIAVVAFARKGVRR